MRVELVWCGAELGGVGFRGVVEESWVVAEESGGAGHGGGGGRRWMSQ